MSSKESITNGDKGHITSRQTLNVSANELGHQLTDAQKRNKQIWQAVNLKSLQSRPQSQDRAHKDFTPALEANYSPYAIQQAVQIRPSTKMAKQPASEFSL